MVRIHDIAPGGPPRQRPLGHSDREPAQQNTTREPVTTPQLPSAPPVAAAKRRGEPHRHNSPPVQTPAQAPQAQKRGSAKISYAITITIAVALGLLIQYQLAGQLLILLYAIASFIWRIPSRTTFSLALLSLGAMFIALTLNIWLIAENFAAYSFLLFAVGAINVCVEQRRVCLLLRKRHQSTP